MRIPRGDRRSEARRGAYATAAVLCCFDGPAWMQKRYTAVLVNAWAGNG